MNATPLVKYGIQTELSDIRVHVGVEKQALYVFRTSEALRAITEFNCPRRFAYQSGVSGPTGYGRLVPPRWIEGIQEIKLHIFNWAQFCENHSSTEKGTAAMKAVMYALRAGKFPLHDWVDIKSANTKELQISGTDIVLTCNKRIQVKCDWRGGNPYLYIQTHECNPKGNH